MSPTGGMSWVVREDTGRGVVLALYLRQAIGARTPAELPVLRDAPTAPPLAHDAAGDAVEAQWTALWEMTVEPQLHTSPGPLELVDGFDTLLALPAEGADELRAAVLPHAAGALAYLQTPKARHIPPHEDSYRAYASAIAEHERTVGRRAHDFELHVEVLPLTQRGLWWVGAGTVAVSDTLRSDAAAFIAAIRPVIAELA